MKNNPLTNIQIPWVAALFVSGALVASCNNPTESTVAYDWALDACGFTEPSVGAIDISQQSDIFHGGVFSRIGATFFDGETPILHEVVMEEGHCRYLKASVSNCIPSCDAGTVCDKNNRCVAYPNTISGGTLTVTGLHKRIEVTPEDWSPGTYIGPAGLPGQLFEEGDGIGADVPGDEFSAVALGALRVAPMDTELTGSGVVLHDGQDAKITWTPGPNPNACIRLVVNGFNAIHGAPLSDIIWCETTDSGEITIPQSFVAEFPTGETPLVTEGYDWPHSELTRYTQNSAVTPMGLVTLTVRSSTYFQPSHPTP